MPDLPFDYIIEVLKGLGTAGGLLFGVLWYMEQRERKASQEETKALLVQVLTVAAQATTSMTEVTKAVATLGESSRDVAQLVRALLSARLRKTV